MRFQSSDVALAIREMMLAAANDGPQALESLANACREHARELEEKRDTLMTDAEFYCGGCRRKWSVTRSYKIVRALERSSPDNCPRCFDAEQVKEGSAYRSDLVPFRYL